MVDDLIERSQESHSRPLWQSEITSGNTSYKERVESGKTCNLSSNHIPKLIINNGNYSGTRPEEFNICRYGLFPGDPAEMHAGMRPDAHDITGTSLSSHEHLNEDHNILTGQQHFKYSGQLKAFNQEAPLLTHKGLHMGETFCKYNECQKACDKSVFIAQEITQVGERTFECNVCGKTFSKKRILTEHQKIHRKETLYM